MGYWPGINVLIIIINKDIQTHKKLTIPQTQNPGQKEQFTNI